MQDYKFSGLVELFSEDYHVTNIHGLEIEIQRVCDSYNANTSRVYALANYAQFLTIKSMTLGQHAAHALHDVTQQWSRNNLSEDQVKRSQERFNELLNEPMPQVPYEKGREEVARLVEQVTRSGGKVGEDAILSLMSALLIGSWTAFESLASDLWVAACNCRPMSLGVKALLAQKGRQQVGEPLHPTTTEQRGQQGKK